MSDSGYSCLASCQQRQLKYEDTVAVEPATASRPWSAFAVFDGHNGDQVSSFLAKRTLAELIPRMPEGPCYGDAAAFYEYAEQVRRAITSTFVALSIEAARFSKSGSGPACGSTATIAVQTGNLLTVANVGNSKCVLDTGHSTIQLSTDDRVGENDDEEIRLAQGKALLHVGGWVLQGTYALHPLR